MVNVCTYQKTKFKSLDAVVLENEKVRAVILPDYGGKMVSFFDKKADYEWLYQTDRPNLELPPRKADLSEYDSSGFHEVFFAWEKGTNTSDHKNNVEYGEIWGLPWEYKATYDGVSLQVHSPESPYTLKKKICLHGDGLKIKYEVVNKSDKECPFVWRPLAWLNLDDQTRVEMPERLEPIDKRTESSVGSRTQPPVLPEEGSVIKFSIPGSVPQGHCSLIQPNRNRKLTYHFPVNKVQYIGVRRHAVQHSIALEPCMSASNNLYDIEDKPNHFYIPAGGTYTWFLDMEVENTEEHQ